MKAFLVVLFHLKSWALASDYVEIKGGNSLAVGNVYVTNSEWKTGPVCHHGWDDNEANVVCKQLGFNLGGTATHNSQFGDVNQRTYAMNAVDCYGNETRIQDCHYTKSMPSSCYNYGNKAAGVICNFPKHVIELKGGINNSEGNVMVRNNKGYFGPICDDYWNNVTASIVCKQLGFKLGGIATNESQFGPVSATFAMDMDQVNCDGDEIRIQDCQHKTKANCYPSEGAGVRCFYSNDSVGLRGGNTTREGNVFVMDNEGYFGPVCDHNWSNRSANVVCKQLGFTNGGVATTGSHFGHVPPKYALDDVDCEGDEEHIKECQHTTNDNCDSGDAAGVICYPNSMTTTTTTTTMGPVCGEANKRFSITNYQQIKRIRTYQDCNVRCKQDINCEFFYFINPLNRKYGNCLLLKTVYKAKNGFFAGYKNC